MIARRCPRIHSKADFEAMIEGIRNSRDLESCKRHHIDAIHSGLCSDNLVANTLIRAYAKCGSLIDATSVFQSLVCPDIVSWNALLQGFVENGQNGRALRLFRSMELGGWNPDGRTFVTALKACSNLGQEVVEKLKEQGEQDFVENRKVLKVAKEELWEKENENVLKVRKKRTGKLCGNGEDKLENVMLAEFIYYEAMATKQLDVFVANKLIDTFAKCGSMEDACLVFDRMPGHDVVSWTTLIQGYVEKDESEIALKVFEMMESRGCPGNAWTFSVALMGCSRMAAEEEAKLVDGRAAKAESLEAGMRIHSGAVSSGCESNLFVGNTLIDMYAKCGAMVRARRVFEGMKLRDVVSWTTLIQGYAENGEPETALEFFSRMKVTKCKPDSRCFVAALVACSSLAESGGEFAMETSRTVYSEAASSGFEQDVFVNTAAVRAFSKSGNSAGAREIFDRVTDRDTYLWNAMLLGHVENGEDAAALELFELMRKQGCEVDSRTVSAALAACASLGVKAGKRKGTGTASQVKLEYLEKGTIIHLEASKSGFDKSDIFVGNTLIDMYAKCGCVEQSAKVFDGMKHRDVVSWTSMIRGYAGNGKTELALELFFSRMDAAANSTTFVVVLVACGNLVAVESGKLVETRIYRTGLESDPVIATALVDFYGKCGEMAAGRRVFDSSSWPGTKDVKLWNSVIAGYSHCGEINHTLSLFRRMRDEGIAADAITFQSMLAACSHVGEVDRGREMFQAMAELGIVPSVLHYSCVVDLLGRASRVDEAVELVEAMPVEADSVAKMTILSARQRLMKGGRTGEAVIYDCEYKFDCANTMI